MVVVLILEEINNENKSKVIKKKEDRNVKRLISGGRRVGGAWGRGYTNTGTWYTGHADSAQQRSRCTFSQVGVTSHYGQLSLYSQLQDRTSHL